LDTEVSTAFIPVTVTVTVTSRRSPPTPGASKIEDHLIAIGRATRSCVVVVHVVSVHRRLRWRGKKYGYKYTTPRHSTGTVAPTWWSHRDDDDDDDDDDDEGRRRV